MYGAGSEPRTEPKQILERGIFSDSSRGSYGVLGGSPGTELFSESATCARSGVCVGGIVVANGELRPARATVRP